MDIRENQLGVSLARSDRETVAGETMSCTVCKHAFVQVAGLLQALKGENLSSEVQAKTRALAATITVTGHHIIDQEMERATVLSNRTGVPK